MCRLIFNPISIGEELGVPLVSMDPKVHKGELAGNLDKDALETAKTNIKEITHLLMDDEQQ